MTFMEVLKWKWLLKHHRFQVKPNDSNKREGRLSSDMLGPWKHKKHLDFWKKEMEVS